MELQLCFPPIPQLGPLLVEGLAILAGLVLAAGSLAAPPIEATPPAFAIVLTFPFVAASAFRIVLVVVAGPSTAAAP